jgi:nucleoid-associated protein YgaU
MFKRPESGAKLMKNKYCVSSGSISEVYLQEGQVQYKKGTNWHFAESEPINLVDVTETVNVIYGLDAAGKVSRYDGSSKWNSVNDPHNHDIVALTSDITGHIYVVDNQGQVYKSNPNGVNWNNHDHLPASQIWKYVVREGDSLWKIAQHEYNTTDNVRTQGIVERIKNLNPGATSNWDKIYPGMSLNMPPR